MKKLSFSAVLSPASLLVLAVLLTAFYAALHMAGWREQVSILSGTSSATRSSGEVQIAQGLVYAGLYFGMTLLVPVLVLAALLQLLYQCLLRRESPSVTTTTAPPTRIDVDQERQA
ncbi:MAG: hypothetical protein JXO22_02935 [Phycisphaerae bacterium]|nr:hypothetical protein [Phycisphaerae bacterium]